MSVELLDTTFNFLWDERIFILGIMGIFVAIAGLYAHQLSKDDEKEKLKKELKASISDRQQSFSDTTNKMLRIIDNFYGAKNGFLTPFSRCLQIAYIYPICFFLIAFWFGNLNSIGTILLFPADLEFYKRSLLVLIYGVESLIFYGVFKKSFRIESWVETQLNKVKVFRNSKFAFITASALAPTLLVVFTIFANVTAVSFVANFVAGAAALAFAGVIALAFAGVIIATTGAVAFAFAVASVGAVAVAIGVTDGVADVAVGVVFVAFAGAGGLVVAFAFAGAGGLVVAFAFAGVFAVVFAENGNINSLFILLFLILPFLNGIFDFLSIKCTRIFIGKWICDTNNNSFVLLRRYFCWTFVDLITAVVFMLCLAFLLSFCMGIFDTYVKNTNWQQEISNLQTDFFGKGLMLALMLYSTLLPTLFHTGMALINIKFWRNGFATKMLDLLDEDKAFVTIKVGFLYVFNYIVPYLIFGLVLLFLIRYCFLDYLLIPVLNFGYHLYG